MSNEQTLTPELEQEISEVEERIAHESEENEELDLIYEGSPKHPIKGLIFALCGAVWVCLAWKGVAYILLPASFGFIVTLCLFLLGVGLIAGGVIKSGYIDII